MSYSAPSGNGFHPVVVPIDDDPRLAVADHRVGPQIDECTCISNPIIAAILLSSLIALPLVGCATFAVTLSLVNTFKHPKFQVDSFSFSSPDLYTRSNIPVLANWTVGISVGTQAKHPAMFYENIEVSVLYNAGATEILSTTRIDGTFRVVPRNERRFVLHPKAWLETSVAGAIANDSMEDGVVDFDLRVRADSTYKEKIIHDKHKRLLEVYCRNLKVGLSSNATIYVWTMAGGPKHCSVTGSFEAGQD